MTRIDPRVEQSLCDRFDQAIAPQLARLQRPGGSVPAVERADIGRPQGYILGACESVIEQHGLDLNNTLYLAAILGHAFIQVYGAAGEQVGLASFDAVRKGELAVLKGQLAGRQDMAAFAAGRPGQPMGFHALAIADGQALATH